ncbi:linoleate 13S-lipoxygenase 2-1, chloroplastic-like [Magnolia sinica]|uniref:linoleate 13S-lipoxygenase 2-1, chloroplastic-like n=1 Tax=Magnolia sinica TaxID=86752 RepID=UPI002658861C|nr:linoleate 13S-lipoxygenase 2-1, chloroplastic-like [Magnolia sinica]
MVMPQLYQSHHAPSIMALPRFLIPGQGSPTISVRSLSRLPRRNAMNGRVFAVSNNAHQIIITEEKAILDTTEKSVLETKEKAIVSIVEKMVSVKAVVTLKLTDSGLKDNKDITDVLTKTLQLELVSSELDPKTGSEKKPIESIKGSASKHDNELKYEAQFKMPGSFGEVGAVLVLNKHEKEMFLEDIVITGFASGPITVTCKSWVQGKNDHLGQRIFFTNKSYLPSQTPSGLKRMREKELEILRGDGQGERKTFERIYDYDVYNDLGDPDQSDDLVRPVLGGKEHPYPRRCRTGRPRSEKDPKSERRSENFYVPRDEAFSEVKTQNFGDKKIMAMVHTALPFLETKMMENPDFLSFTDIDSLFDERLSLPPLIDGSEGIWDDLFSALKSLKEYGEAFFRFGIPQMIKRDRFSWLKDEEFARQTLAGLNPISIQLVTEFPFVSKLDPKIYGPPKSAITKEHINCAIKGHMTADEALERKKLFMIDYHDLLLPYVNKVRELEGTTLYGSRTLFFLLPDGTLRPIVIELTRPPSPTQPQWKKVFTPGHHNTNSWLWKFTKAHVCAHDSGYHQLISHWLRTHCCIEPYIIAANRQLSTMHPIHRLLQPHFRYTMEINAFARHDLINGDGIIQKSFSPKKYCMELSSVAYDQLWRFDMEALPADLIRRGMAVEDPTAEHGLKLTIEDYPYANDGLLIWSAIKQWVSDYVTHYYPDNSKVSSDRELQAFWTEVRTKGHEDKNDEPWWPILDTTDDLIHVLTTIIWVASAHHAAVNFGQYNYGGYFPNRPTIMRTNMPTEELSGEELERFWKRPESMLLESFPSQVQAATVIGILDALSTHSPDEEYLGELPESAWTDNPAIKAAFEEFSGQMRMIEGIINKRNINMKLRNRTGAGVMPYELLKPFSEAGVTGMGVPNSVSI